VKNSFKKFILSNRIMLRLAMYFRHLKLKKQKKAVIGKNVLTSFSSRLEGNNYLGNNTTLIGTELGFASYISENSFFSNTKIGKYCSIGPNVKCILGRHPSQNFVSTHPAFFSVRKQAGFTFVKEQLFEEFPKPLIADTNFTISIGNDVWIGANVSILDGVTIGDGAIVASNALVNKDIPPYMIYGGVPAKLIKPRFSEEHSKFLQNLKWWDNDFDWIKKNAKSFVDITHFSQKFQKDE